MIIYGIILIKKYQGKIMKFFIKLILIAGVAFFSLINLRAFTFYKGLSKTEYNEDDSLVGIISTISNIEKIEYYEKTFKDGKYIYNVYIKTKQDCYLLKATQEDIDGFSVVGIFSSKFNPEKISPIPIYVDLIIMFIILILPLGKKRKQ